MGVVLRSMSLVDAVYHILEEEMQSPFIRPEVAPQPTVLKPFRYCEFRVSEQSYGEDSAVTVCPVMASDLIEEMPFCYAHAQLIIAALEAEGGNK